jgi:hypothetical protein
MTNLFTNKICHPACPGVPWDRSGPWAGGLACGPPKGMKMASV